MKRTYTGKKKAPPRKVAKRFPISRDLSKYSNERVHYVKRQVDGFTASYSAVAGTGGAFIFRLASVPGSAELISMYDQYKICGVKLVFFPAQTQASTVALVDQARANCRFLTCIDYNDGTPAVNSDELRQYESCKVNAILDKVVRYVPEPKFVNTTGQTVSDWMSTGSSTTNWFGLKYWMDPTEITSGGTFTHRIELTYYLCFKNIK